AVLRLIVEAAGRLFADLTPARLYTLVEGGLRAEAFWIPAALAEAWRQLDPVQFPTGRLGYVEPLGNRTVDTLAVERRETVYVPDLTAVPPEELPHPGARRLGARTMASFPLRQGERVLGVLGVGSAKPDALSARPL